MSARSASIPPRRSRTSNGHSRSLRKDTPNAPRRSPVSARPPTRPDASPRRRRPWRRRSHRSVRAATSPPPPARWSRSAACFDSLGDPRQWTLPAEALELLEPLGPSARARRGAHRGGRQRSPPGEVRGRDPHRRSGARARRGARPSPPRARPRLPGHGPRQPRRPRRSGGLPRGDRARDRGRAGTRGGPAPQQPGSCSSGASKVLRRPWRSCARGSPTRRPGGSPRCSTAHDQSTLDALVDTGEHR